MQISAIPSNEVTFASSDFDGLIHGFKTDTPK
jgi:hypothetical protein